MALTADRGEASKPVAREVIVQFSPEVLRAPFALRCGALFIDYILILAVPVLGLVLDKLATGEPAKQSGSTVWLIAMVLGICDLIVLPALAGQSLGMMISGLRVVTMRGRTPTPGRMILRNTLGYLLTLLTAGLGFALAIISPNGRALHDYISGTMVVFAKRKRLAD